METVSSPAPPAAGSAFKTSLEEWKQYTDKYSGESDDLLKLP